MRKTKFAKGEYYHVYNRGGRCGGAVYGRDTHGSRHRFGRALYWTDKQRKRCRIRANRRMVSRIR